MSCIIGKEAPKFNCDALLPDGTTKKISLDSLKGKYVVILFYPKDFTFVCPTELVSFSNNVPQFDSKNAVVLGVSVDSVECHAAWCCAPASSLGLGKVNYPLLSDLNHKMSHDYGVLCEEGYSKRGVFIINPVGILKSVTIVDDAVGRNVDEVLRLIDAFQHVEKYGEVCPANWKKGDKTIKPTVEGMKQYMQSN